MSAHNNAYGCIIRELCSLPECNMPRLPNELSHLIGSFLRMSNRDRIKYMLANRNEPAVFICCTSVVDELDEVFELRYRAGGNNIQPLDTWPQMKLIDRIVSLNSRVFQASLHLPYWGKMKTEYTLFALLRDMQDRGSSPRPSVFKWRDIFNSTAYTALGKKIRSLWDGSR